MKIRYECLPCLVNQAVKVADMTDAPDREELFRKVFSYLGTIDFSKSNPEIIGMTFALLKEHIGNPDPYKKVRDYYNKLFDSMLPQFEKRILESDDPFATAVKYAVIGNIIDFNPVHNRDINDITGFFENAADREFTISHVEQMKKDILKSEKLLYIGDNCGEICLDKLLLSMINKINPDIEIWFATRGLPVVNDSIEEDAYAVGMDQYAHIINNGDGSLGTILPRSSSEFKRIFKEVDVIIAKGQANYESLSEESGINIYYLLMTKCKVIATDIGVAEQSLICLNRNDQ